MTDRDHPRNPHRFDPSPKRGDTGPFPYPIDSADDLYAFIGEDGSIPMVVTAGSPAGQNVPMLTMLVASRENVKSLIETVKVLRDRHPERWKKKYRLFSFTRGQEFPDWDK